LGAQNLPPWMGDEATTRLRRLVPPSQEALQADQSYQSPHSQSLSSH
jgi:hypothetical protein